ncbi:MAG TPA: cytochrome c3 family protein [Desulfatirhabdiaceae bacterium]|nr:cytochrome c3 family protein [Desulfatirhabdiaceae bacterium]
MDGLRAALRRNRNPIFITFLSAVLVAGFVYFFYTTPGTRIGPEQPIPFSHRVHAGVKDIQCEYCHPYVSYSRHPGLPPVEKCLHCHNHIIRNHYWIQKEHAFFNTRTPIRWNKANVLPEHVLFNHQRHIQKDIACKECHGQVETVDRITGEKFLMEFCITCHRQNKANVDCWLSCHG